MRVKSANILLVAVILALASLGCSSSSGEASASVGSIAPDFTLTSVTGKEMSLAAFRGRPVVLNFFTTWCGPCRDEMPGMQAVFEDYMTQGLVLLAVDLGDAGADVKSFARELGLSFPVLLDGTSRVGDQYGVNSYPRTFFIDSAGVIRKISFGSMAESEIAAGIEDLLEQSRAVKKTAALARSGKGVEGCVNIGQAIARSGPGKKFSASLTLGLGECYGFDAHSRDGAWLRMSDLLSAQGSRLWVAAGYIDLKADVDTLPAVE